MGTLQEAVVVVTGASRGLGRAIAEELGRGGAKVVVNYSRSKEPAEGLVQEISENGGEAIAVQADVSDPEQAQNQAMESKTLYKLEMFFREEGLSSFVYDEEKGLFRFPEGRFAFSRTHADLKLLEERGY